jgi:predicted flap endonuclease-1-like 5' DNA nuclease
MQITITQVGRYNTVNEAGLMRAQRCSPGDTITVPDWYAQSLIADGLAEPVATKETEPDPAPQDDAQIAIDSDHHFLSIEGVGLQAAHALVAAGFKTLADLGNASDAQLLDVEHVGPATLRHIRHYVGAVHAGG